MKSRAELEELLAAQRAQRKSVAPPRKRSRNLLGALVVVLILLGSGAAMYFAVQVSAPKAGNTPISSPSPSSSASPTAPFTRTPVAMKVCTDIPDGRLHVRFAAGNGSEVRGYLTEGETVLFASGNETIRGEVWQQITSPITGWVNARYLCNSEGEE